MSETAQDILMTREADAGSEVSMDSEMLAAVAMQHDPVDRQRSRSSEAHGHAEPQTGVARDESSEDHDSDVELVQREEGA